MKIFYSLVATVLLGISGPVFAEITQVTCDSATVSSSTGRSTESGTVVCNSGDVITIDATLIQILGESSDLLEDHCLPEIARRRVL